MSTRLPIDAWTAEQRRAMRRWIELHGLRPDFVPDDAVIYISAPEATDAEQRNHWVIETLMVGPDGEPVHDPERGGWQRRFVRRPYRADCPWPVTG